MVERFDVDGLLFNYIRHGHCFPTEVARNRHSVMTEFLRRIREILDRRGAQRQKNLTLGVMIPQTLEECHNLGFDIPTWIEEGLIDYICPCDFHFADFNAPYEEFGQLTRGSDCLMYPTLSPMLCRGDDTTLLTPENYRALAQNFYGAGADGVSVFNYQYHWARKGGTARYPGPVEGYPLSLSYLRDLHGPKTVASQTRHYRYHPLWGGKSPIGAVKDDKTILTREVGSTGRYRFRLCEGNTQGMQAVLYFSAQGLLLEDEIGVELNGVEIHHLQRVFHPDGRLETFGRPLPPFSSVWFNLNQVQLNNGDNHLEVQLTYSSPDAKSDVIIDEVEVVVMPV